MRGASVARVGAEIGESCATPHAVIASYSFLENLRSYHAMVRAVSCLRLRFMNMPSALGELSSGERALQTKL